MLVSSCFLPLPWRWIMLAGQALFYGLAAFDPLVPASLPLKRLSSAARTFVAMMVAAVWGMSVFFVPPRSLWKESKVVTRRS
jgi:hypothetical protein